jgi:hypothetical protein
MAHGAAGRNAASVAIWGQCGHAIRTTNPALMTQSRQGWYDYTRHGRCSLFPLFIRPDDKIGGEQRS